MPDTQSFSVSTKVENAAYSGTLTGTLVLNPKNPTTPPPDPTPVPSTGMLVSPYLYQGWGSPPPATTYMRNNGVRHFTMAFILADNSGNPAWDGKRPLNGGVDEKVIKEIRAAGGDVTVSFGGATGNKLGDVLTSPEKLAAAYIKVIDAYGLKSIDIDVEGTEFRSAPIRARIIAALQIVKQQRPGVLTILTIPTAQSGPESNGKAFIAAAKNTTAVDNWTLMPFDFGQGTQNMGQVTIQATNGLVALLKNTFGYSDAQAFAHAGISSMNGITDTEENVTPQNFREFTDYARSKKLGRLTYWSVNRDPKGDFARVLTA